VPTNLPPQYFAAEKDHRRAKSPAEKLEALETMLEVMPKHKGTEQHHGGQGCAKLVMIAPPNRMSGWSSGNW
jgi:hypothetical protein